MRRIWLLALALLLAAAPALASAPPEGYGMTAEQAQTFAGLLAGAAEAVLQAELDALLEQTTPDAEMQGLPGQMIDGMYYDPMGFDMAVPEGWTLLEHLVGPSVALTGPAAANGFVPSITVTASEDATGGYEALTQADFDALLTGVLENYQFQSLEDFALGEIAAREFACLYGPDAANMLLQYQLLFTANDRAYVITMTTLAEEDAQDAAMEAYDAFLASFSIFTGEGNG